MQVTSLISVIPALFHPWMIILWPLEVVERKDVQLEQRLCAERLEGLPGGSMLPSSQQNFPCVLVFPKSISSILAFPVSYNMLSFSCSQFYFPFVPLFPKLKWPCSLVPQNLWEALGLDSCQTQIHLNTFSLSAITKLNFYLFSDVKFTEYLF